VGGEDEASWGTIAAAAAATSTGWGSDATRTGIHYAGEMGVEADLYLDVTRGVRTLAPGPCQQLV